MLRTTCLLITTVFLVSWVPSPLSAAVPDSDLTYQGRLTDASGPVDGIFDLEFRAFDAATGGNEVGVIALDDHPIAGGRLTAVLDFGDIDDASAAWLEIAIRPGDTSDAFTILSPRQPVTAAPHAMAANRADHAASAAAVFSADDADTLQGYDGAFLLEWSNHTDLPSGFDDGDDDVAGNMSCEPGEVATWNGTNWVCDTDDGLRYRRTVHVPATADPSANGAALREAVLSLPTHHTQESAWQIFLEPGVYDLGADPLVLPRWTGLTGSGERVTVVRSAACYFSAYPAPVIACDADTTVRNLTVENLCSSPTGKASGITIDGDRVHLEDLTVRSLDAPYRNTGVLIFGQLAVLERVTAEARGGSQWTIGIENQGNAALLLDCTASATGGTFHNGLLNSSRIRIIGGRFSADSSDGTTESAIDTAANTEIYDATVTSDHDAVRIGVFANATVSLSRMTIAGRVTAIADDDHTVAVLIEHSKILAFGTTVQGHSNAAILIGSTQLAGDPVLPGGGLVGCAGVWDESWLFYPNTCP